MDGRGELDSLITILDRIHASEFVVLVEPALVSLLSALAPYSTLKKHGVKALVPLTDQNARIKQNEVNALVYITTGSPEALALISQNVKLHLGASLTVAFAPEIPPSASLLFTRFDVLGEIELVAWPLSLIPDPITPDLLSLFHAESAANPADGVWVLVWALNALQASAGAFGKLTAVGPRARLVASLLEQYRAENAVKEQQKELVENNRRQFAEYHFGFTSSTFFGEEIEHVIVIDRDLDLITPLMCQTTYEGVLAETVGLSASGTTQSDIKVSLQNDPVFASISESGFAEACESLHESAKELQNEYRVGNAANAEATPSIAEIRSVVAKLGSLQATQRLVDTHTELASQAMAALERGVRREAYELQTQTLENRITNTQAVARIQDLIFQGAPIAIVLRLLVLLCIVRGGLKENVLQTLLYGDILKTYGYEHLKTIHYLYERGLIFSPRGSSFLFSASPLVSLASFGSSSSPSNTPAKTPSNDPAKAADSGAVALPSASNVANLTDGNSVLGLSLSQTYSWYTINKAYKLYPSDAAESKPYAGLTPLTARIAQMALGIIPKAKTPLEPEFFEKSFVSKDSQSAREAKLRRTLLRNSSDVKNLSKVLVVIVGGVTYAEATAIKRAATVEGKPRKIIVASTSIITGNDLVLR